ncbi:MAG: PSD1 domain-containing protein, partial [Planctomycetaceae bacterium]|nr:PSD1 domain-containing protein [Planctomycetaceae bacterium]
SIDLQRGRDYFLVERLSKSVPTERADYNKFKLWVNPKPADREQPAASVNHPNSVNFVRWVGFSTGQKTEPGDQVWIDDLVLSRSWDDVMEAAISTKIATQEPLPGTPWEGRVSFTHDVYPLLKTRCFQCHSGVDSESGYRLDVRDEVLGYSTGDPLAEPGKARTSRLLETVTAVSPEERMPPAENGLAPLSMEEIGLLAAWIEQGMPWDEKLLPTPRIQSDHWAFQRIERPVIPNFRRQNWGRNPLDAFIATRQEAEGLTPAEEAPPQKLVRRLYLDLIGLPPTPEQTKDFVEAFRKDSESTYSTLVEDLLASRHYGERWGRYWLDLARWAESHGHQHDIPRPYAWRYRDYVINSFNDDKPYDRFLTEQIAGDELQPYTDENLIATGFLAAARISGNNMDKAAQRNDVLVDITNVTGSAVLGLTMECVQCHNHKFDPISQRDYYRLHAFFVNGQLSNLALRDPGTPNPTDLENWMSDRAYKFYMSEADKLVKKKIFDHTEQPHTWGFYAPGRSDSQIERMPVVNRDPIRWNPDELKNTSGHILIRGDITRPGPEVTSGWPEVLGPTPVKPEGLSRLEFTQWLTSRDNPLTARVWANRVWQWHFGRGIVATPNDFGTRGSVPTHPELLDWLAVELMENGWSTRHLHRLIVHSATYRQQRLHNATNASVDPGNLLLWNWPLRRLEAEAIRDAVLVATGELDHSIGGPSIPARNEENALRRTLYLYQRRSEMPTAMKMFDSPELVTSCPQRGVSTVALQPLYLLNSDFMMHRAEVLSYQVRLAAGEDQDKMTEIAFLQTLGRVPTDDERKQSLRLLEANGNSPDTLVHLCHALLNLNEFLYIP